MLVVSRSEAFAWTTWSPTCYEDNYRIDLVHWLIMLRSDIIHGDVKPENTLVFEEEIGESHNKSELEWYRPHNPT